jgi:hypothetical protein
MVIVVIRPQRSWWIGPNVAPASLRWAIVAARSWHISGPHGTLAEHGLCFEVRNRAATAPPAPVASMTSAGFAAIASGPNPLRLRAASIASIHSLRLHSLMT